MLGVVLGSGALAVHGSDKTPCPLGAYILAGETDSKRYVSEM